MATTPEGRVKRAVSKLLSEFGMLDVYLDPNGDGPAPDPQLYSFMPVQSGLGKRTLDYLSCYRGYFIAIETKAPKKDLTEVQKVTKRHIEAAGGTVFVISSHKPDERTRETHDTLNELRAFLSEIRAQDDE